MTLGMVFSVKLKDRIPSITTPSVMWGGLSDFPSAPTPAAFGTTYGLYFQHFWSVFRETANYILLNIGTDLEVDYEIVAVSTLSSFSTLHVKAAVMAGWPKALATLFCFHVFCLYVSMCIM